MAASPAKTKPPPKGGATSAAALATFTPSDSLDIAAGPCIGFVVGTAGFYTVTFVDDVTGTQTVVWCNTGYNPYVVKRIWAAGAASATGIMPLYA
jgi:hypothetical protein